MSDGGVKIVQVDWLVSSRGPDRNAEAVKKCRVNRGKKKETRVPEILHPHKIANIIDIKLWGYINLFKPSSSLLPMCLQNISPESQ